MHTTSSFAALQAEAVGGADTQFSSAIHARRVTGALSIPLLFGNHDRDHKQRIAQIHAHRDLVALGMANVLLFSALKNGATTAAAPGVLHQLSGAGE